VNEFTVKSADPELFSASQRSPVITLIMVMAGARRASILKLDFGSADFRG
jgi:hypothetical protein